MDQQQSKLDQLADLMKHPLRLLRQGGRFGLNIVKKAFTTILLFATVNLIAVVGALIRLVDAVQQNLLHVTAVFAIAILAMILMVILVYRMTKAELSLAVYKLSVDYLHKLSEMIVAKIKQATPTAAVSTVVNVNQMVSEAYSMIPASLRKLVSFFIAQVPLVGIISTSREAILKENQQKASDLLYRSMSVSIQQALERKIGPARTLIVLFVNILLQFLIIKLMK